MGLDRTSYCYSDDLSLIIIDVFIVFFAGGNLRIQQKLVKYFFALLLIGCFFLITINCVEIFFRGLKLHNITTFEELAETQSPVFIAYVLQNYEDLRSV